MKHTLIVGASGELGGAVARALTSAEHHVYLHGYTNKVRLDNLADEVGARAVYVCDVRDATEVSIMIDELSSKAPLNGLVYAAGINPSAETVDATSLDSWNKTIGVNLTGAFHLLKYSMPILRQNVRSAIVIVSSIFGLSSPANRAAYGASKHGLTGLVQSISKEEGERVRINAVCPGPMWSENVRKIFAKHAMSVGISVEDYIKQRMSQIPYGRFPELDECAAVVDFLLSDRASFISGELIRVAGGEH